MVGLRGEAPLVPPYILPSFKKALALGILITELHQADRSDIINVLRARLARSCLAVYHGDPAMLLRLVQLASTFLSVFALAMIARANLKSGSHARFAQDAKF